MICKLCLNGAHCGQPGERSPSCFCQHYPPGTRQSVCQYACLHQESDHVPGRGCTVPRCPCLWKAQEQVQPDAGARPEPSPVSQDPPAPTRESQSRVRDLDLQAYLKRRRPNA